MRHPIRGLLIPALFVIAACNDHPPLLPSALDLAKGGAKNGSGSTDPVVSAVSPTYGEQGEVNKKVRVSGSGFDNGSTATWYRGGSADPKITTNSTRFISSTELEADITIAADADLAVYDVVVMTSGRKTGIGTELFEIVLATLGGTFYLPTAQANLGMWGDGHFASGNPFPNTSRYKERECGIRSKLFFGGSGDATADSDTPSYRDRKCSHYPRRVKVDFSKPDLTSGAPAGVTEMVTFRFNTLKVHTAAVRIPIGETQTREMVIGLPTSRYCDGLRFRLTLGAYGDFPTGADLVNVTRVDARTWRVWTDSQASKAYCIKNDVLVGRYHIPIDFYVVADQEVL